jgi:glycosyl transferase family 25
MRVLYIASDHERSRIEFMSRWLNEQEIDHIRVPGVTVDSLPDVSEYDSTKRVRRYGFEMTASEVGCFLAHRECWKLIERLDRSCLVLESDCCPVEVANVVTVLDGLQDEVTQFDIARLHGIFENNEKMTRKIADLPRGLSLVQTLGDPMGAGAYFLNPRAANRLLDASQSFFEPVDVFLAKTWAHKLRYRSVKPYPFRVADFPSTIGSRTRPRQSTLERLKIELSRFGDDLRRLAYLPLHYFR